MELAVLSRPFRGEEKNGDGYFVVTYNSQGEQEHIAVSKQDKAASKHSFKWSSLGRCKQALMAIIDGVGHGIEAAITTERIIITCIKLAGASDLEAGPNLKERKDESPSIGPGDPRLDLAFLVEQCHRAAVQSRGAAMGIAHIDFEACKIRYIGVGNVRLQVISREKTWGSAVPGKLSRPADSDFQIHELVTNNGVVGYNLPQRLLAFDHDYAPSDIVVMCSDGIDSAKCNMGTISEIERLSAESAAELLESRYGIDHDDATVIVLKPAV